MKYRRVTPSCQEGKKDSKGQKGGRAWRPRSSSLDESPAADKDRGGDVAGVGAVTLLAAGGEVGRAVEGAEAVGV